MLCGRGTVRPHTFPRPRTATHWNAGNQRSTLVRGTLKPVHRDKRFRWVNHLPSGAVTRRSSLIGGSFRSMRSGDPPNPDVTGCAFYRLVPLGSSFRSKVMCLPLTSYKLGVHWPLKYSGISHMPGKCPNCGKNDWYHNGEEVYTCLHCDEIVYDGES